MIDTLKIFNELKEKLEPGAALKLAEIIGSVYSELSDAVTKTEFNELKDIVYDLLNAQKQTTDHLNQLLEFQYKVEKQLEALTQRVDQLAEAQRKTEERLNQLAEAQKKTEERLEALTQRVDQLAEAQRKTEKTIQKLTRRVDDIAEQLGGISNTIGYRLEDQAYRPLKQILEKEYQISVDRLYRKNLVYSSKKYDEINIYGEGQRNGTRVFVIGECKAQFGVRDVNRFLKLLERLKTRLAGEIFPITLAYQYHPVAEEILKQKGIYVFWSYEIPNVLPYSDIL